MELLLRHREDVRAQIGIITLNEDIRRVFEPNAARIEDRLRQIAALNARGIPTEDCGCKNPDLGDGTCNIGGAWPGLPSASVRQSLFDVQ